MIFDIDASQGEWFYFRNSTLDPNTGEPIFDKPEKDARVQIRSMTPFFEGKISAKNKAIEHVYNPKTRAMERISYIPDISVAEAQLEREDAWDYAITGIESFKDKEGNIITCTRANKLALMKVPVFDRFVALCLKTLAEAGVKKEQEESENL
jgi:hypothetical protein